MDFDGSVDDRLIWGILDLKVCETFKLQYLVDMKSILNLELKGEQDGQAILRIISTYVVESKTMRRKAEGWNSEEAPTFTRREGIAASKGFENNPLKKQKVVAQKTQRKLKEGCLPGQLC